MNTFIGAIGKGLGVSIIFATGVVAGWVAGFAVGVNERDHKEKQ